MKASAIIAFLASATSAFAIAIPTSTSSSTSATNNPSSSSSIRSGHPEETDNNKTTEAGHECEAILEQCEKGFMRTEAFCKEHSCYETKGACYSGLCDTYSNARAGDNDGDKEYDEERIGTLAIAVPSSTSAIETPSSLSSTRSARPKEPDNHLTKREQECADQLEQCKRDLKGSDYVCKARLCYITQKNCFREKCFEPPLDRRAGDPGDDDDGDEDGYEERPVDPEADRKRMEDWDRVVKYYEERERKETSTAVKSMPTA